MPMSDQAFNDFRDTPEGQEWARTGGKLGYGLSDPQARNAVAVSPAASALESRQNPTR
jgi:hypothetical protein